MERSYKTVPEALLKMVTSGELTTKQTAFVRDAHENEKAEWRNNLISVVNEAYSMGQKRDPIGKQELVNAIIAGRWDA